MISDVLIRSEGMRILTNKLGLVEAEKFITLILRDHFNYTEWQQELYMDMEIQELSDKAMEYRNKRKSKEEKLK